MSDLLKEVLTERAEEEPFDPTSWTRVRDLCLAAEPAAPKRQRRFWIRFEVAAACVALVAVTGILAWQSLPAKTATPAGQVNPALSPQQRAAVEFVTAYLSGHDNEAKALLTDAKWFETLPGAMPLDRTKTKMIGQPRVVPGLANQPEVILAVDVEVVGEGRKTVHIAMMTALLEGKWRIGMAALVDESDLKSLIDGLMVSTESTTTEFLQIQTPSDSGQRQSVTATLLDFDSQKLASELARSEHGLLSSNGSPTERSLDKSSLNSLAQVVDGAVVSRMDQENPKQQFMYELVYADGAGPEVFELFVHGRENFAVRVPLGDQKELVTVWFFQKSGAFVDKLVELTK